MENNQILKRSARETNSGILVSPLTASKEKQYNCPHCSDSVIFCQGKIIKPYFRHGTDSSCTYFTNETLSHLSAKYKLCQALNARDKKSIFSRNCIKCNHLYNYEIEPNNNITCVEEFSFLYNGSSRRADIAGINESNEIEYIIEICNTHKTSCDVRPEPWFEFNADEVLNADFTGECIHLKCIRSSYTDESICNGLCYECENIMNDEEKGIIYFNQRGAGCGKTYESIQLIQNDNRFMDKDTYIYLTKMNSAKDVIYNEFKSQVATGKLPLLKMIECEAAGNQYRITLERMNKVENNIIKIIIGTIDSFTFAISTPSNKHLKGDNAFNKLVSEIRKGNMEIGENGKIQYAKTQPKLTRKCLTIIDEGQDLDKIYIQAFEKIIDHTGIDTYIIGDELQSILSEKNLFTHLKDSVETNRLKKNIGNNIVKRFHNNQFIGFVNNIVKFENYGLPEIEGICDNCNGECGYMHENDICPYKINNKFDIWDSDINKMSERITEIINDMKDKINKHGYLPHNFCFIFPVVNANNKCITMLYPALQSFWYDFFSNADSYTDKVLDNMKNIDYWKNKIRKRDNDDKMYQYVYYHRSEENKPIDLTESQYSSRIMSIHASKGTGCECVYLLGLSEFNICLFTGGHANTLVYESLIHVGLTRQKKYLYIGIDRNANDDINKRLSGYFDESSTIIPDISIIKSITKLPVLCKEISTDLMDKKVNDFIDYSKYEQEFIEKQIIDIPKNRKTIDWGHHVLRNCVLKTSIDGYLCTNLDLTGQQIYAKIQTLLTNIKFHYCIYKDWKTCISALKSTIRENIISKKQKQLVVPILIFSPSNKSNDYSRFAKIIELFINSILDKLKNVNFTMCPIECLIYCHLQELIHDPDIVNTSIIDVYNIISSYNDCFCSSIINTTEHSNKFKCKCSELFNQSQCGMILPHKSIQNSIIHHYEAIENIYKIMEEYNSYVKYITNNQNIFYNIDKKIYTKGEIKISYRVPYIGLSEDGFTIVYMAVYPQFNRINMYKILREIWFTYFILLHANDDKYKDVNNIHCAIITLDSTIPIWIDFNKEMEINLIDMKNFIKELLSSKYYKHHETLFRYMEYKYMEYKKKIGIKPPYVAEIIKYCKTDIKLRGFPPYILSWIEMQYENIANEKNQSKRTEMKENIQNKNWVCQQLNDKFDFLVNQILYINVSSGWDSD